MDGWTQTLSAGWLLGIAAMAIVLILLLIVKLRVHALLTLVSVSLLTAVATGLPMDKIVNDVLLKNFGGTLGSVALLVGLGAMLGRLVETSGGAQSLADALIRMFGEKRAPFALGVASLIFGFPIFFDAGLVVMLPIVFATARRMKQDVLPYALAQPPTSWTPNASAKPTTGASSNVPPTVKRGFRRRLCEGSSEKRLYRGWFVK